MRKYEWLVTEDLLVTYLGDDGATDANPNGRMRLLVRDAGCRWAGVLTMTDENTVLMNGELAYVGDGYPQLLGLLDEVAERVGPAGDVMGEEFFVAAPPK